MQVYLNMVFLCLVPFMLSAQNDTIPIIKKIGGNNMEAFISSKAIARKVNLEKLPNNILGRHTLISF